MPTRMALCQLGTVIVAADRAFHVVACKLGQNQRVLGTVQVKDGITGLEFLGDGVISKHDLDLAHIAGRFFYIQICSLYQPA